MSEPVSQLNPTRRFSDRVDYYLRARPRYPAALLDFFRTSLGLDPNDCIADVGSGTGFLSELFLKHGNLVFGIEPNGPMREAAETYLSKFAKFHSIDARAEETTLPRVSVRFVVAGQAFHWFDRPATRKEFRRILAPNGWVALIWNERVLDGPHAEFANAYEKMLQSAATDLNRVSHAFLTSQDSKELAEFFGPAGNKIEEFYNPHTLDLEGLRARALSSSYLPLPGQSGADEMLEQVGAIFQKCQINGKVVQDYRTRVYYGALRDRS